jgi:hypothetical protein
MQVQETGIGALLSLPQTRRVVAQPRLLLRRWTEAVAWLDWPSGRSKHRCDWQGRATPTFGESPLTRSIRAMRRKRAFSGRRVSRPLASPQPFQWRPRQRSCIGFGQGPRVEALQGFSGTGAEGHGSGPPCDRKRFSCGGSCAEKPVLTTIRHCLRAGGWAGMDRRTLLQLHIRLHFRHHFKTPPWLTPPPASVLWQLPKLGMAVWPCLAS